MSARPAARLSIVEDVRHLSIKKIRTDGGTQSRVTLNVQTIDDYAVDMREGATFPPIVVFHDGKSFWLASGFHRIAAAQKARLTRISAEVRRGTRRDAILHSVAQNVDHGLRRTNADKNAAVRMLLGDPEWRAWSDSEIARQCRVSRTFVGNSRKSLMQPLQDERTVSRGGREYTMDVRGLGAGARQGARRERDAPAVFSSVIGDNDDLIAEVARLYLRPGDRIADVTYGKGVFWRQVDLRQYDFHPSDAVTLRRARCDFRRLPFANASVDVVVLDPPYAHDPGRMLSDSRYQNAATTRGMSHDDILDLYAAGMREALRVLRPDGLLWVKCKDEVVSGLQRWSHIELLRVAEKIGFTGKDLFLLTQKSDPIVQHETQQQHARKNFSFLWIMRKRVKRSR